MKVFSGLVFVFVLLFSSCFRGAESDRQVIARVKHAYLYADELNGVIPSGLSEKDSMAFVVRYVNQWIERQLIISDAENLLIPTEKNFKKKIRDYRNSLLIFEWEKKMLFEKLDSVVTDEEIAEYYETNQEEFVLQSDIVRVLYIKLNINSPFASEAMSLLQNEPFNKEKSEQFCRKYAVNYFLDIKSWLYIDELQKEIPLSDQQRRELSPGNSVLQFKDNEYIYFLKVIDIRLKGSISPLALENQTIHDIILQKRKNEILNNMTLELRTKAEKQFDIEKFI